MPADAEGQAVRITTIVPAAGRGERFAEWGPKPLVRVTVPGDSMGKTPRTRSIIEHVCSPLPRDIIVATTIELQGAIREEVPFANVISIGAVSSGQADTILRTIVQCRLEEEILVVNCDELFALDLSLLVEAGRASGAETASLVGRVEGDNWSFVDQIPSPVRFAERERLSEWGMLGAWWFRSAKMLAGSLLATVMHEREPYLSQALGRYSRMVHYGDRSTDHYALPIPMKLYKSLGTPERVAGHGWEMERAAWQPRRAE